MNWCAETHRIDPAAAGDGDGFFDRVDGRVEDDLGRRQRRIGAQLLHELVAVHGRHQDVGDDQVGALGAHQRQAVRAVDRFQQAVAGEAEQGLQELAVGGAVVDDQDGRHYRHSWREAAARQRWWRGACMTTPIGSLYIMQARPSTRVCGFWNSQKLTVSLKARFNIA